MAYLREVGEILGDEGAKHLVLTVGGAVLAYHGIRETTIDVDTVRRMDQELAAAATEVAKRNGLDHDWLNMGALPYVPATLTEDECDLILEQGRLTVLGAPVDQVFLMKLRSDRTRDQDDLVLSWGDTTFKTADQVNEAYERAYPGVALDEYERQLLEEIIEEAEATA